MNYFLFSFITFSGIVTYAFESTITLSIDEMKKNTAVIVGGNMNKDDMLNLAARVFQLQLRASKCDGVAVNPRQLIAAEREYFYHKFKKLCD